MTAQVQSELISKIEELLKLTADRSMFSAEEIQDTMLDLYSDIVSLDFPTEIEQNIVMSIPESLETQRMAMWGYAINENASALAAGIDAYDAALDAVDNSDLSGSKKDEADEWLENARSDAYTFRANAQHRDVTEI